MNTHDPPNESEVRASLWATNARLREELLRDAGRIGRLLGTVMAMIDFMKRNHPSHVSVIEAMELTIKETEQ